MRARILLVSIGFTLCGAAACGGGGGGGSTAPSTPATPVTPASPNDVVVKNNLFDPSATTVAVGSTVTWTWATCSGSDPYGTGTGQTCVDHSVAWDSGDPGSATQQTGTYQRTFTTAGTYTYHCAIHGTSMSGKVVVQ